ncbi:MAG: copper chaperone PCu(A)C [Rhodospirillaceae bacterium]
MALTALLPVVARAEIKIEKPWVRETIGAGKITAGYGKITNTGDDSDILLSVTTPVAATAELHQSMDKGGRMTMAPVARLEIPRMGAVELKPGGYHLMIMNVTRPLKPGEKVSLVFTFMHAGAVTVAADVLPVSASAP